MSQYIWGSIFAATKYCAKAVTIGTFNYVYDSIFNSRNGTEDILIFESMSEAHGKETDPGGHQGPPNMSAIHLKKNIF